MADFISFAALYGPAPAPASAPESAVAVAVAPPPPPEPVEPAEPVAIVPASTPALTEIVGSVVSEFAILRARAAECLEAECEQLLRALAYDVLGRELQLAPVDLVALIRATRETFVRGRARILVAPADLPNLRGIADVEADARLRTGDVVLELPEGSIDMRMGTRIAASLESVGVAI